MWIPKADYRTLIEDKARAEASVSWLTVRLNQLEHELGQFRAEATGRPQLVPRVESVHHTLPEDREIDFNDIGDETASRLGVTWDALGRVGGLS